MKKLLRFTILLLSTTIVACLPEVETIDPTSIVEWGNYTTSDGLAGNQVNTIISDSKEVLWIGTNNGVSKYDGNSFINYSTSDGLVNNFVSSIVEFETDVMVFGTDGGLGILDHGNWYYITDLDGNGTPFTVTAMLVDSDGLAWIGTDIFGLLYTDGSNFFQVWDDQCYDCNFVNFIFSDSNNVLWFGTDGGVKKLENNSFTRYTTSNGLPNNSVQSIYEDSWETLWVGTYNGLSKKNGAGFESVSLYNSAPQNWTYSINQDSKKNIWFSSIGNGLIYSNGSSMRTEPESLNDHRISTISSFRDANGVLWFGTFEGGLWKYIPK